MYLKRGEGHTGGGPRGAVSDRGLSTIHHTLLLQGPLWGGGEIPLRLGCSTLVHLTPPTRAQPYLQRLGDSGFGGLVHLCLPHTPTA